MWAFLNRVSEPGMAAPRAVLEDCFSRWPANSRADLGARLRAKDDGQFLGTFWELYLHELHLRLDFECERDPELPDSRQRPDFLVRGAQGSFYLEATVVGYPTAEATVRKRRRLVVDMVNAAYHPDFALRLHALTPGDRQPSKRQVVAAVEGAANRYSSSVFG
jgi:hypothetical protein